MHLSGCFQKGLFSPPKTSAFFEQKTTQMPHPLHHSLLIKTCFFGFTIGSSQVNLPSGQSVCVFAISIPKLTPCPFFLP
jgi:hypothetical protein